jgi:hypothetical protein
MRQSDLISPPRILRPLIDAVVRSVTAEGVLPAAPGAGDPGPGAAGADCSAVWALTHVIT